MAVKKEKSLVGTIVFLLLAGAVVVGIYLSLTREKPKTTAEIAVNSTEAQQLLKKDMIFDYPQTPREVLKLYCRITKCLYNDELTDAEIEGLMYQMRSLYADELLAVNDEKEMLGLLKGEIKRYHDEKMTIYNYTVDSGSKAEHLDTIGGDTTILNLYFTIRQDANMTRAYEEFTLIQDKIGNWKIIGFRTTPERDLSE